MHQFGRDFALVEGTLALALLFTTQLAAAEARVQDAEGHILDDTPTAQAQRIQGRAAAIRANIARYTGDLAGCVANGQQVLRLLPESETIARTIARLHVARAFRVSGAVTEGVAQRAQALTAPFRAADNLLGTLASITNLARLPVLQGRLHAAAATYGEMAQIAASPVPDADDNHCPVCSRCICRYRYAHCLEPGLGNRAQLFYPLPASFAQIPLHQPTVNRKTALSSTLKYLYTNTLPPLYCLYRAQTVPLVNSSDKG